MSELRQISCREAVARLYDFLDREGPDAAMEEVEEHLNVCRYCCGRFAFEATLWKVVRDKGGEVCECPETLHVRIKAIFEEQF